MARKYSRDNRGRFASAGATARGGRLRTAAGNKRATVKGKIGGAVPSGTIRPGRRSAKPVAAAPAPKPSSGRRRRPTAAESRANGLMPISEIRARQAAANAAADVSRTRRVQSNMTRARGQQVASNQGKQRAPFGRYSTIKNPAAEGTFPQMAPGRSGLGMAQAAKGRSSPAALRRKTKSDRQVLEQADRVMGKLAKRMKSAVDGGGDLNQKMRQIQRYNRRGGRVNAALSKRRLLDKYQELTAGADHIHGTRAGKGIRRRAS